ALAKYVEVFVQVQLPIALSDSNATKYFVTKDGYHTYKWRTDGSELQKMKASIVLPQLWVLILGVLAVIGLFSWCVVVLVKWLRRRKRHDV
ncbi:MAG: hypothetical protein ACRCWQ_07220, partial [Bacilli bacterium]